MEIAGSYLKGKKVAPKFVNVPKEIVLDPNYNSDEYLKNSTQRADKALLEACDGGSPKALETFYKLNRRLIERKEETVKVEHTVADRQRIAEIVLDGFQEDFRRCGVCQVCGFSKALRIELCVDSKPELTED